jgi:hypothetical protein
MSVGLVAVVCTVERTKILQAGLTGRDAPLERLVRDGVVEVHPVACTGAIRVDVRRVAKLDGLA